MGILNFLFGNENPKKDEPSNEGTGDGKTGDFSALFKKPLSDTQTPRFSQTSRFSVSRQSFNSGNLRNIGQKARSDREGMQEKAGGKKEQAKKYYAQGSEELRKIAPELAKSFKEILPDSFSTREKSKEAISRILGAGKRLSADSRVHRDTLRSIQKAVKDRRWNDPSLKNLTPDEFRSARNASYEKRRNFVGGIKELNPKKFGI